MRVWDDEQRPALELPNIGGTIHIETFGMSKEKHYAKMCSSKSAVGAKDATRGSWHR